MNTQPDYLPISMLNQLEYCERRFYLMYVLGEMDINVHVLEGTFLHENAHNPGTSREGEKLVHRRLFVWSDELMISGFTDVVENQQFILEGQVSQSQELIPVEYKKGHMGKWMNDHIQLCAQTLCIAERNGVVVPRGYIFYFGSRRREEVEITAELRMRTVQSIHRAHTIVADHILPPPIENYNKCRDCSLEPACLPREVKILREGNK